MSGLETVLAMHPWRPGTPTDIPGCYCGWRCPAEKGVGRHDQHATHVAAAIREYLLSEAVVEAATRAAAFADGYDAEMWRDFEDIARAALTAATEEDVRDLPLRP